MQDQDGRGMAMKRQRHHRSLRQDLLARPQQRSFIRRLASDPQLSEPKPKNTIAEEAPTAFMSAFHRHKPTPSASCYFLAVRIQNLHHSRLISKANPALKPRASTPHLIIRAAIPALLQISPPHSSTLCEYHLSRKKKLESTKARWFLGTNW